MRGREQHVDIFASDGPLVLERVGKVASSFKTARSLTA